MGRLKRAPYQFMGKPVYLDPVMPPNRIDLRLPEDTGEMVQGKFYRIDRDMPKIDYTGFVQFAPLCTRGD